MKLCKVCSVPVKIRRGYCQRICEACQKFFRRYVSKKNTLICSAGTFACIIDKASRPYCLRCRFDKCVASGLHCKSNKPSPKTSTPPQCSELTPPAISQQPVLYDGAKIEQTLRNAVMAFTKLHGYYFLPMSEPVDLSEADLREKLNLTTKHITAGVEISSNYCSFLADCESLSSSELQILMAGFTARAGLVFPTLVGKGNAGFFGIHCQFKGDILKDFPCFETSWNRKEKLQETLTDWNPGFVECAVFMALLFFNEAAVSNQKLDAIRKRLIFAVDMLKLEKPNCSTAMMVERSHQYMKRCLRTTDHITMAMVQDLARYVTAVPIFAHWIAIL